METTIMRLSRQTDRHNSANVAPFGTVNVQGLNPSISEAGDVRFGAHSGLKSDIAQGLKSHPDPCTAGSSNVQCIHVQVE
jgi:hypothetical protein